MKDKNFINSALKVIEIESKAVKSLSNQIQSDFDDLCTKILDTKGKLILMGIGKSGHIAQKISATLSSTGTSSFFIHPTEAAHGDLGMISKQDAILILSNSGETKEIIEILPALKRSTANIFTLTNNNESTIAKAGKINLVISADEEACPLDLAPTSSTTINLVFGDALAIALLEARGFSKDDFAKSHPAGQLGKKITNFGGQRSACLFSLSNSRIRSSYAVINGDKWCGSLIHGGNSASNASSMVVSVGLVTVGYFT